MTSSSPQPETRAKRGRKEIRLVFLVVLLVVVGGAIYALLFGSPNAENRARDDPDRVPNYGVPNGNQSDASPAGGTGG